MFSPAVRLCFLLLTFSLLVVLAWLRRPLNMAPGSATPLAQTALGFEANHGQAPATYPFIARQPGFTLGLAQDHAALSFNRNNRPITLRFHQAQPTPSLTAEQPLNSKSHYLIGNDRRDWQTDVPQFARIRYENLYPGIDALFYGNGQQLEYDWLLAPHADPQCIGFTFAGADGLRIEADGALLIQQDEHQLRQLAPKAYQVTAQGRRAIQAGYVINEKQEVSFALGDYDATLPLVIDPVLSYSTYLGGASNDAALAVTTDASGNIYVAGHTASLNFPLRTPYEDTLGGGNDAFVMKLDPTGSRLIFSTYLGGRGSTDRAWDIAVDSGSNVYIVGETNSLNYPTTANAAQPVVRGNGDAFATKLNTQGNVLLYSTYLGGNQPDMAYSLALDRADFAYLTGRTNSANFPLRNALQAALHGERDAFVTKLHPDGLIVSSTYLGGDGAMDEDVGYGIALDALNQVFVTGVTTTADFPTANAWQSRFGGGGEDAFLCKLNLDTRQLLFSTYLGGDRADGAHAVTVDGFGNPIVTGYTLSTNFPRHHALQNTYGGSSDAFVTKFRANGSALIYSTYLGGASEENTASLTESIPAGNLATDALGAVYLTGKSESDNFPVVRALQETRRGDNDAFLSKLTPAGNALIFSTYFGTSYVGTSGFDERGVGLWLDAQSNIYLSGQILGNDLQTMLPLQNRTNGGTTEAFLAKVVTPDLVALAPVSAASYNGAALAPDSIVALFGSNLANETATASSVPLPTTLQGVTVTVKDSANVERPAPLFFVSPNQVNLLIPTGTAAGAATLSLTNPPNQPIIAQVLIEPTAPALFTANASGTGLPAALALRIKPDGTLTYESVAVFDEFQQRFVAAPIDLGAETEQVFLILYGSGLRNRSALEAVTIRIGGVILTPTYAGSQGGLVGLDQINVLLSRNLAGRGNVSVETIVDGQIANTVSITIR
jgi:uncharacterized protein (TIGR03437 family)